MFDWMDVEKPKNEKQNHKASTTPNLFLPWARNSISWQTDNKITTLKNTDLLFICSLFALYSAAEPFI